MRLLPQISQPTLDSFRKDVYRPRLALLLLILLLGGKKQVPAVWSSSSESSNEVTSSSHLGDKIAAYPAQTVSFHSFSSYFDKLRVPSFISIRTADKNKTKRDKKRKEKYNDVEAKISHASHNETKRKTKATNGTSSTSILQLPKIAIQLLMEGEALIAIIPLHVLWIVRLAGMMIEDSIVKSSTPSQRLQSHRNTSSQGAVLIKLALLAILALSSLFLTSSSLLKSILSALSLGNYSSDTRKDDGEIHLTLSFRLIVILELTATLFSLSLPLMKLNTSSLSRIIPRNIFIPSPSHSPAVIDMLPLPPGLAEVLSGRASSMQTRASRRRGIGGPLQREPMGGIARHGGIAAPLILPSEDASNNTLTLPPKKAPRIKGLKVQVDSGWLLENMIVLWGHYVGSTEYLIISLSLPSLSPTSFPPILAFLALRSQLSAFKKTWTNARGSIECLEFVRRRWSPSSHSNPRWTPDQQAEVLCPICFEQIEWQNKDDSSTNVDVESCRLDCGHDLHAVCLVQMYLQAKQAYCPCCHDALKATPPSAVNTAPPPPPPPPPIEQQPAPINVDQQ